MSFKVIFIFISVILAVNGGSDRVKRQSPFSVGMRMIEGIRGGVQKTFQNFMGRFRNRNQNEFNQNDFPARIPRPPPPNFLHPNIIHHPAPDPVFKTATSSSFAVFHDGPTPAPAHSNPDPNFFYFNDISATSHRTQHQQGNLAQTGNFVHHQNIIRPENVKSIRGSPPVKRLATSKDGWVALIPSENDLRYPKPRDIKLQIRQKQKPFASETAKTDNNFPTGLSKTRHAQPKSNEEFGKQKPFPNKSRDTRKRIKVLKKPHVKRLTEPKDSPVNVHPIPSRTPEPIYSGDIRKPLHSKPTRLRDEFLTTTEVDFATNSVTSRLQPSETFTIIPRQKFSESERKVPPQNHKFDEGQIGQTAKLISNGLKFELSQDKEKINGYEFGYGIVDQDSGNRFYHAEKKNGNQTKGSYKVQLPDGRIQTVDYMADDQGYHPKITFEGEAKYPGKSAKKYIRPPSS